MQEWHFFKNSKMQDCKITRMQEWLFFKYIVIIKRKNR